MKTSAWKMGSLDIVDFTVVDLGRNDKGYFHVRDELHMLNPRFLNSTAVVVRQICPSMFSRSHTVYRK